MSIAISSWSAPTTYTSPLTPSAAITSATDADDAASASSASSTVEANFLKFAQMSPEERVQQAILSKLGMTQDEFDKLDAKAKGDVLAKVRDEILRQMDAKGERRTGAVADITV